MRFQILACFLLFGFSAFAQGIFSDTSSLVYARNLYDNKEYEWCEEVLAPHIGLSKNDSLYLLYAKTKFRLNSYSSVLHMKHDMKQVLPQTQQFIHALCIYLDSLDQIENLLHLDPQLKAYLYLKEADISSVNELLQQYELEDSIYLKEQIQLLQNQKQTNNLPIYSAFLIPGSGKYILGVKKDGLISFLSFGTYGFLAIRAFDRYGISSTFAWVNTALAMGFYGANIVGTKREIKRQKLYKQQVLKKSINEKLENYMFSLPH